ncbi:hypothetical protein BD289DRAFT_370835 [Coniella lustricola]|uniref:Rhodopsin domain-containing protein n=1 Tax=Coniella lustricola TaxID=2025994 RepID=A0A2T3A4M2_9PEZI|nr:hypothetical protein BD289DRAFT_370835 [Coniella lustricola]
MVNADIEAVFGTVPAGLDIDADTRPGNTAAVVILLALATISVGLRLVARSITRTSVQIDDYLTILALVFVWGTAGLTFAGGAYGAGTHVWTLTIPKVVMIYRILFSYTFVYAASVSTTKISILCFYYRIFQTGASRVFTITLALAGFLAATYPIIIWVTMPTACKPMSFFWEHFVAGTEGKCGVDISAFFLALGIINMINDVFVLLIPVPQIWKLQMSLRKRLGVIAVLTLGSFVCIASIVRIHYLSAFMNAIDVTFVMGPVFIWSSAEPSIGILGACMPSFPPLVRLVKDKAKSGYATYRSNNSTKPISSHTFSGRHHRVGVTGEDDEYQLTTVEKGPNGNFSGNGILVESDINYSISMMSGGRSSSVS